jgi:hypothetical protein
VAEPVNPKRLCKLLGMLGSAHSGERDNAVDLAIREVRAAGENGQAILLQPRDGEAEADAAEELQAARDACAMLVDEVTNLRAALTQRGDQPDWIPAGTGSITITIADFNRAARWALERHAVGEIVLNEYEQEFLGNMRRRPWPMTEKQQRVFDRAFRRVFMKYGLQPPP